MRRRSGTKADQLYEAVRSDILHGRLTPGTKLAFAELSARYNAGVGLLREALPRLVEQGLATTEPQLGYRVRSVSLEDLADLTEARVIIETLTFQRSIEHGDLAWESRVVAAHHHLAALPVVLPGGELNEEWIAVHSEFHRTLLDACPNKRLREVSDRLRDVAEVYRCWALSFPHGRPRDVAGEHMRMADAAVARNVDEAVQTLSRHITLTTELVVEGHDAAMHGGVITVEEPDAPRRSSKPATSEI
ncbi:MAG: hypothetical protein ABS81_05005 [Pseudonocardia sp. SCN 72-86]|nr:MAG: hypothetical protein ABS81_05005 [Pseudonocardia sp. SCN 72-86]